MITLAAVLAALLATPADELLLKDGRLVRGAIVPGGDAAVTRVRIGSVEIPVPAALIERTWVETVEDYVPRTPQEADYLRRGWVLFEGTWMSRTRREERLAARADARKAAIAAAVEQQQWSHAVEQPTRHFLLVSNASEPLRAECARRLEAVWQHAAKDWGVSLVAGDKRPIRACVYRRYEDYGAATNRPRWVRGFDDWITRELHVWLDPRTPEDGLDVLNHEVTHLLVAQIDPDFAWPIWLNEGLAEYYGSASVRPDGSLATGAPQFGRLATLRAVRAAGRLPRLREVLLTETADFHDEQYAVAWSFVRFLLQSPRYGRPFRLFFASLPRNPDLRTENVALAALKGATRRVAKPADVIVALERRLGRGLEPIEEEWLREADQDGLRLTPQASYEAARRALLEPRTDGSHLRLAIEAFEAALAGGITDARCWRDYAELVRRGGILHAGDAPVDGGPDPARALSCARRAIELDPLDPYNYLEAAGSLVLDGPAQDLDAAEAMCAAAEALAAPDDPGPAQLVRELRTLIEPARARRAAPAAPATPPRPGG